LPKSVNAGLDFQSQSPFSCNGFETEQQIGSLEKFVKRRCYVLPNLTRFRLYSTARKNAGKSPPPRKIGRAKSL